MNSKTMTGPRRGLNETEASNYVGYGLALFRQMVADGRMPRPRLALRITANKNEIERRAWDIAMLDAAIDSLPVEGEENAVADTWADFNGSNQTQKRRAVS